MAVPARVRRANSKGFSLPKLAIFSFFSKASSVYNLFNTLSHSSISPSSHLFECLP